MSDAPITDVFRFVAARPAQLPTETTLHLTTIHDERATQPEGRRKLAQLAESLTQPNEALARWQEIDLTQLQAFVPQLTALLAVYESSLGVPAAPPQDAATALANAQIPRIDDREREYLASQAWDALYTAYLTGPDAGSRLEIPTAALRVLQFMALAASGDLDVPEIALQSLRAKPFIDKILRRMPTPIALESVTHPKPPSDTKSEHARALVEDIAAAQRLSDVAVSASTLLTANTPTITRPRVAGKSTGDEDGALGGTHDTVEINTTPQSDALFRAGTTSYDHAFLATLGIDRTTPLPAAAEILRSQLASLTTRALQSRNDPSLIAAVRESAMNTDLARILAENTVIPSVGGITDPSTAPATVDVSGRIRPLGIGDLKVVKQVLLAYVPGEIAHIEAVLKGESKERVYRALDRTQTTVFTSEEETRETTRDTQSTDRFEVKKEAEQTLKENMSLQAGITASGSYGPVTVTAHGDFAYSTSSESSQHQSSNFAREVIDKSVTKVQTRNKTERTVTILHETEETNTHGIDNAHSPDGHINGIYRWVDKRYRAQVYNYGTRMMLEFVVPEPAAFYRAAANANSTPVVDAIPPPPFVNIAGHPLTANDMTAGSYAEIGARYGTTGLGAEPPESVTISASLEASNIDFGVTISKAVKDLTVPDGYQMYLNSYSATVSLVWGNYPRFTLMVGEDVYSLLQNTTSLNGMEAKRGAQGYLSKYSGSVPVSLTGYDIGAYAVNVQAVCWRTPEKYATWQIATYDKIYSSYQALQTAYDQKLSQALATASNQVVITGNNPGINEEIQRRELKRLCLTMLTGQHFEQFNAVTHPADAPAHYPEIDINEAMREAPIVQFFEQAFEWEQLTYLFYPYFWANKSNWVSVLAKPDPDPLFTQFLTAGWARVLVPVSPAYDDAVLYFLETPGTDLSQKIWQGGDVPHLNDALYVSIADELRSRTDDLAGATPEGEPWEFTLPTTLVWLQPDDTLPVFT